MKKMMIFVGLLLWQTAFAKGPALVEWDTSESYQRIERSKKKKDFGPKKKNRRTKRHGSIHTKAYFESLEYIAYKEGEPVLRQWFTHHTKRKNLTLNVRAQVMDVQGVARLIINGMGVGILPDHLVQQLSDQGEHLYVFPGSGSPLENHISLAYLKGRTHGLMVSFVLNELKQML